MGDRSDGSDEGREGRYVAPVGRVARRTSMVPWILIASLALGVAILKPWAGPGPSRPDSSRTSSSSEDAATRVGPTDPALSDAQITPVCHNTDAWLLSTVESSRGQTIRVLRVLSPTSSPGPSDPSIPRLVFGSEQMMDLGWCAPVVGGSRSPGVTRVEAWVIVDGRAHALPLAGDMSVGESRFGALYLPPQGAALTAPRGRPGRLEEPAIATWATGVYVFTLHDADGGVHSFAVDLEILPGRPRSAPTPAVPPADVGSGGCVASDSWLVQSEEHIAGGAARKSWPIDPVVAIRPDDPAIPWVRIATGSLAALGWCGPQVGAAVMTEPISVEAWALEPNGIRVLALVRLGPGAADPSGGLYRPDTPSAAAHPTATWPAGRYVFRVHSGDGRIVTFGIEVGPATPSHAAP